MSGLPHFSPRKETSRRSLGTRPRGSVPERGGGRGRGFRGGLQGPACPARGQPMRARRGRFRLTRTRGGTSGRWFGRSGRRLGTEWRRRAGTRRELGTQVRPRRRGRGRGGRRVRGRPARLWRLSPPRPAPLPPGPGVTGGRDPDGPRRRHPRRPVPSRFLVARSGPRPGRRDGTTRGSSLHPPPAREASPAGAGFPLGAPESATEGRLQRCAGPSKASTVSFLARPLGAVARASGGTCHCGEVWPRPERSGVLML